MKADVLKQLRFELVVGIVLAAVLAIFLYSIDFVDWWYQYTRAHESWELDEIMSVVLAILITGSVMAVRHVVLLTRALEELQSAQDELATQIRLKGRHEKLVALGELSGGLAHEINNALQLVLGLSEILKLRVKNDEELHEYMSMLEDSALHARNIVRNVLSFSRNSEAEFENEQAVKIFRDAVIFAKSMLPGSVKVAVSEAVSPSVTRAVICCDKTGMMQIFMNIFKNAADAMDGQGTIRVEFGQRMLQEDESDRLDLPVGEYVTVSIIDHGCGMDEDTMSQIFNPFFTTKDEEKGSGLGMASVYGLIKQQAGGIHVESQPGKGSSFTLLFPVARYAG